MPQSSSIGLSRRDFLRSVGAGLFAAAVTGCQSPVTSRAPQRKPNFVFFLIDDMGWRDLGCFGSLFYETPNIDRLARQAMRFTDAYAACPVCSPTRASIMSGKYPARIGLTNFIAGRKSGKLLPPDYLLHLPLEETTFAEALQGTGYATGFFGKWHLGDTPYLPDNQGFGTNVAGDNHGAPPSYFSPYGKKVGGLKLTPGPEGEYLTDRLTDEAVSFINLNHDRPFLVYLSHYAVHVPLQAKKDITEKYLAKAKTLPPGDPRFLPEGDTQARQIQDHAVYAAMVESVDASVGNIMTTLEKLQLADDTVIIFMSDNGGLSTAEGSPTANVPLRAGKGWLYEGGIREPMIIRWPGVARPDSVCSVPVISTDFYPTILEIAGLPPMPQQHRDGISLVPLLKGGKRLNRANLFWHYPHYSNQGGGPGGAIRSGDYKLIEFFEDDRIELYNLRTDISETKNLAVEIPGRAKQMRKRLHDWRTEVGAKMPTPNPEAPSGLNPQLPKGERPHVFG